MINAVQVAQVRGGGCRPLLRRVCDTRLSAAGPSSLRRGGRVPSAGPSVGHRSPACPLPYHHRASSSWSSTRTSSTVATATATAAAVATVVAVAVVSAVPPSLTNAERGVPTPSSGDVISAGTPVKESATGILFPPLCNGYFLVGMGVRYKWGLVSVYAVGTYMDPLAMSAVKDAGAPTIERALLDPTYPRTIRLVMNRAVKIETFTNAIVESLEPRMKGQDLDKLEEFKSLNPPVNLIRGAEIEMTIRGDTLLYKNAVGGVGTIRSEVLTRAMCDVYYGLDSVSPTHKKSVLEGIPML